MYYPVLSRGFYGQVRSDYVPHAWHKRRQNRRGLKLPACVASGLGESKMATNFMAEEVLELVFMENGDLSELSENESDIRNDDLAEDNNLSKVKHCLEQIEGGEVFNKAYFITTAQKMILPLYQACQKPNDHLYTDVAARLQTS